MLSGLRMNVVSYYHCLAIAIRLRHRQYSLSKSVLDFFCCSLVLTVLKAAKMKSGSKKKSRYLAKKKKKHFQAV